MTDPFEQRRWYVPADAAKSAAAAGRIDELFPLVGCDPDLETIASNWLFVNSFSRGTIIKGINRVMPAPFDVRSEAFADPTQAMVNAVLPYADRDVFLALSGGLDSRTLLAVLLGVGIRPHIVSYGAPAMADVIIARRIAEQEGLEHTIIDVSSLDADDVETAMRETAIISEGTYNVAHAAVLPTIRRLMRSSRRDPILLDGAFGGLLRGGMGNGLVLRGADALRRRSAVDMAPLLTVRSLEIFHPELRPSMTDAAMTSLQRALDAMPPFERSSGRAWADEFFLRWNTRGFVANPLRIYERWFPSAMPFLDTRVVASIMKAPPAERKHAHLFRRWIRQYRPSLTHLPFVGKASYYSWWAAGSPIRTRISGMLSSRAPTGGYMEQAVLEAVPDVVDRLIARGRAVGDPFYPVEVERLTSRPSPELFPWLTLALALDASSR